MSDFLTETIEVASPYIICAVAFFALGAGVILYLDRNYKQHIQCASCEKKTFSSQQDEKTSDKFTESERQNLKDLRHLVRTGQVSEDIR